MSLKLDLSYKTLLQDMSPLNSGLSNTIGTGFKDDNSITEDQWSDYDSGRDNSVNKGGTLILEPHFFIKFLMIESQFPYDIEMFNPLIDRTPDPNIPAGSTTLYGVSRLFVQFGLYEKLILTSLQDANPIKYLLIGSETQ